MLNEEIYTFRQSIFGSGLSFLYATSPLDYISDKMPTLSAEQLQTLTASIFNSLGAPRDDAELVSQLLVEANLSGFDSHGVIRLPIYARGIKQGAVKPGAEITLVKETASTAILDGGWNFGQVVCQQAMNLCIEKAKTNVIGLVLAR